MNKLAQQSLDSSLDKLVRSQVYVSHRSLATFQVFGCIGLALAAVLATTLAGHRDLSYWVLAGIIATAIATFLALVMATKIITGEERIIYYHHEIGVMAVVALVLWTMRQPLLPYLDVMILGIGTFLVFGRIGCLMVGCCHGRPHGWGVRYGEEHASAGFPPYLVGVRLFPIQAVESLWVLCVVVVGTFFVWSGRPPGTALAWYVITYDVGRFAFEFARGDAGRAYWLGFSQPQWLSLLLTGGIVWAELAGVLPLSAWHGATFALLVVTVIAISLRRRVQNTSKFHLLHPRHVREIAQAVELISDSRRSGPATRTGAVNIPVTCTSLGVQISGSEIISKGTRLYHYTLSYRKGSMTREAAAIMASLILRLKHVVGSLELIRTETGVFHLVIHPLSGRAG